MVSDSRNCAQVNRRIKRSKGEGLQNTNAGGAPAGAYSWRTTMEEAFTRYTIHRTGGARSATGDERRVKIHTAVHMAGRSHAVAGHPHACGLQYGGLLMSPLSRNCNGWLCEQEDHALARCSCGMSDGMVC